MRVHGVVRVPLGRALLVLRAGEAARLVRDLILSLRTLKSMQRPRPQDSILTIPLEDLMASSECFEDDEAALVLPYTCRFMTVRWFLEGLEHP